ncbi:MAG: 6-phosphofructokinase [Victivallaceae bacterium]
MAVEKKKSIAVMTSGGDAQGMNAAVRSVVRCGISLGLDVYAILEGYQGLVEDKIRKMEWDSVSGILERGGTIIGTARSKEFRERSGRIKAAANLVKYGIDNLVIIGGDGSLTGANQFRSEWPELLAELAHNGVISKEDAVNHSQLHIVGMVGSIDNDMANTDMTIGADSALHRITEAIDALSSTAASHQRTFVVEVMGRNCGYLALMSAIATGAAAVFIPEAPPKEGWEEKLCSLLLAGRKEGRRDSILIVAEGARDRAGNQITCAYIKEVLGKIDTECRITILGHVQRGGAPSAFDRYMSTASGCAAVRELLREDSGQESSLIVMRDNRIKTAPLMESVNRTKAIAEAIANHEYEKAEDLRGSGWSKMINIYKTLCLSVPTFKDVEPDVKSMRLAVMTCGWPAPGMNNAIRTAVRIGINQGHEILGIEDGCEGLIKGRIRKFNWMDVEEWNSEGGSALGTIRRLPEESDYYEIARNIEKFKIQGILMIGGWSGYQLIHRLYFMRKKFPAFKIPVICIPASINNNLPGSELAIGADTALNTIISAIDKIKHSADSSRRAFVVEVMGRYCGYLAMMSGLATGAENIYMHENGVTLDMLREDVQNLIESFKRHDRGIALIVRNEKANPTYTTDFICELFEEEGKNIFDVRKAILGPMQQGGDPSPFDRIQAVRLAYEGITLLINNVRNSDAGCAFIGQSGGKSSSYDLRDLQRMVSEEQQRPNLQWWESLLDMGAMLAARPKE